MWARVSLIIGIFAGFALLAGALAALYWLLMPERFPVARVEVVGTLKNTAPAHVEAAIAKISGNFFALDLAEVRERVERLPWVRRVAVRRVWPATLEVTVEEHVALARWGDDALVNTYGERFNGHTEDALPVFLGPAGTEREVARRYARFATLAAPLGSGLERVVLTQRYAWQLRLASGLHVMLGRDGDAAESRLRRFVEVYPETLGRMARKHEYVDLRYPNGFALRVPELRG